VRAQISISKNGTIHNAKSTTSLPGGVLLNRKNSEFTVTVSQNASCKSLTTLIQTLRAIDQTLLLKQLGAEPQLISKSKLCVLAAKRALSLIEQEYECPFASTLDVVTKPIHTNIELHESLRNFASMVVAGLDTPAALIKANMLDIPHLTSTAQNRSMRLFFVALPTTIDWPVMAPRTRQPIDSELDDLTARWLSVLYDTALAARQPLFHHGTIELTPCKTISFQRILYPITPTSERPGNHRVLSAAICLNDPDIILI